MIDALIWFVVLLGVILFVALPWVIMSRWEGRNLNALWQGIARQLPPDGPQAQETTFLSVPVRLGSFTQGHKFDPHAFRLHVDVGDRGIRLRREISLWGGNASRTVPLFLPWTLVSKAIYRPHDSGMTESTGLFLELGKIQDDSGQSLSLQVHSDCAMIGPLSDQVAQRMDLHAS